MKDLNKVLSGNILIQMRDNLLIVRQPSVEIRHLADFFAEKAYEEAFEQNIFVQDELEDLIIENGWWTQEQEDELKKIPKDLEQMKVDYFNSFLRDDSKRLIKKGIKQQEERFEKLTHEKYQFFNYTCESLQSQAYTIHILKECTFYENGDRISLEDISIYALQGKYNAEMLSDDDIRELSKVPQWRMTWNMAKDGREIFSFPACDLTDMQKSLISWTRMYDSIYESMEVPSDEVIDDNHAVDGWFVVQRRKREDDRKGSKKDSLPDSAEVFVPVGSQKEAARVHDMNTGQGKGIIKSRFNALKEKGTLDEGEFPHVRQDLQMQSNKALFDRYKK